MPVLPQELIDHIIDHVGDRDSLKACSLVCSQWSARSRKHLFVRVDFTSATDPERWCACVRPGPSGPSSLVETLVLSDSDSPPTSRLPSRLHLPIFPNAISHFRSFSALRVLMIWERRMTTDRVSSMFHSFGPSLENVTRLTLWHIVIHPATFAMFINHFPRLDDLSITSISLPRVLGPTGDSHRETCVEIVPTHPRGNFRATDDFSACRVPKEVFEVITLLEPRFHRVSLTRVSRDMWRDYWPLVDEYAGSLEELLILVNGTDADCDGLSLARCPNLRKIVLSLGHANRPCKFVEKCLSTITSAQLSEVSLCSSRDLASFFGTPGSSLALWDSLDIILYNLAVKYRPQYEGEKMLVELVDVYPDPSKAENFLRRFRERGNLRVNSVTRSELSKW